MSNYQKQVDKNHYSFGKYYYPGRWMSYWHEVDEILNCGQRGSVLDVGPGSDLLKNILAALAPDISYKTLDIAQDVQPDHIGGVTDIPIESGQFDVVCAFQVLEHIEFKDVPQALVELSRVSKKHVLISLPHFGPSIEFQLKLPFVKRIRLACKIPFAKKHVFGGQHYWEIGKNGYSVRKIRSLIQSHFTITNEYVPFENQYHRFFILEKK